MPRLPESPVPSGHDGPPGAAAAGGTSVHRPRRAWQLAYAAYRRALAVVSPITLGVRLLLVRDGRVVLVAHTYRARRYLPGGGVKAGETLEQAARREAAEEAGGALGALRLFGVYTSFREGRSDHVVVFACEDFRLAPRRSWEIAEVGSYPLDRLPDDVAAGSRRRIEEYLRGAAPCHGPW